MDAPRSGALNTSQWIRSNELPIIRSNLFYFFIKRFALLFFLISAYGGMTLAHLDYLKVAGSFLFMSE